MGTKQIFILILLIIAAVLLILAFSLYSKAKSLIQNATAKVSGRVVDYQKLPNDFKTPIVRYLVDEKEYFKTRVFSNLEYTRDHDVKENKAQLTSDDVLRVRNSKDALKSIEALFPRNMSMMVYYNPKNPQESYVEKYSPMYTKAYIPGLFGICFVVAAAIVMIFIK